MDDVNRCGSFPRKCHTAYNNLLPCFVGDSLTSDEWQSRSLASLETPTVHCVLSPAQEYVADPTGDCGCSANNLLCPSETECVSQLPHQSSSHHFRVRIWNPSLRAPPLFPLRGRASLCLNMSEHQAELQLSLVRVPVLHAISRRVRRFEVCTPLFDPSSHDP